MKYLPIDVPETVYLSIVDAEARDHSSESIAFVYTERPHISLLIPDKAPVSLGRRNSRARPRLFSWLNLRVWGS